jgi:hypothetical protein
MVKLEDVKTALVQIKKMKMLHKYLEKDLDLIERIILDLVPAAKEK